MKILAQAIPNNTIAGFQRAAEAAGHTWIWWEERHTPAFDVFDEVQPDMVMLMELNRPLSKCIKERKPAVVQGFEHKPFTFEVNNVPLECERLVDSHMFNPGDPDPAFECVIGIVSGPTPVGLNLCFETEMGIKIMSETPWPVHQYLGVPSLVNKRQLYRSSQVVLVPSMVEAMRVIACGSVPISCNPAQELHEEITFMDAEEVADFAHQMVINPQIREDVLGKLRKLTVNRTYDTALNTIMENVQ
jgi:hypothetical protein